MNDMPLPKPTRPWPQLVRLKGTPSPVLFRVLSLERVLGLRDSPACFTEDASLLGSGKVEAASVTSHYADHACQQGRDKCPWSCQPEAHGAEVKGAGKATCEARTTLQMEAELRKSKHKERSR